MPQDQELETLVADLVTKGESPEVIASVIDQWDATNVPGVGMPRPNDPSKLPTTPYTSEQFTDRTFGGMVDNAFKEGATLLNPTKWPGVISGMWEGAQAERARMAAEALNPPAPSFQYPGDRLAQGLQQLPGAFATSMYESPLSTTAAIAPFGPAAFRGGRAVVKNPGVRAVARAGLDVATFGGSGLIRKLGRIADRFDVEPKPVPSHTPTPPPAPPRPAPNTTPTGSASAPPGGPTAPTGAGFSGSYKTQPPKPPGPEPPAPTATGSASTPPPGPTSPTGGGFSGVYNMPPKPAAAAPSTTLREELLRRAENPDWTRDVVRTKDPKTGKHAPGHLRPDESTIGLQLELNRLSGDAANAPAIAELLKVMRSRGYAEGTLPRPKRGTK